MLFDVPDVGARFYTYTWTLFHVMAACAEGGVPVIVLDRPNPLGGDAGARRGAGARPRVPVVRGRGCDSHSAPADAGRDGAALAARTVHRLDLRVITCDGWTRAMRWPDTGLPWVPTSPAMPSFESAQLYPGTLPVRSHEPQRGARHRRAVPASGRAVARRAGGARRPGAAHPEGRGVQRGRPSSRVRGRTSPSRAGAFACASPMRAALRPVALGLLLMAAIVSTHRLRFQWARYPTAANPGGDGHFERLIGTARHPAALRCVAARYRRRRWCATGRSRGGLGGAGAGCALLRVRAGVHCTPRRHEEHEGRTKNDLGELLLSVRSAPSSFLREPSCLSCLRGVQYWQRSQ